MVPYLEQWCITSIVSSRFILFLQFCIRIVVQGVTFHTVHTIRPCGVLCLTEVIPTAQANLHRKEHLLYASHILGGAVCSVFFPENITVQRGLDFVFLVTLRWGAVRIYVYATRPYVFFFLLRIRRCGLVQLSQRPNRTVRCGRYNRTVKKNRSTKSPA